ncbi:MAG: TlpA disulfide reductase family protein [Alistipes sp.]|nr:TlpA disulfide reductase family protein [Alistipes sp.]
MKRLLACVLLPMTLWSCSDSPKALIRGTFTGFAGDTVILEEITSRERRMVDTTVTSAEGDYKFRVKFTEASPSFFNILCHGSSIPLIVAPGERITVNSLCNLSCNYTVEGSDDSQLLKEFNGFYTKSVATLDSISRIYVETPESEANTALRRTLREQYVQEYYRIKREHIGFIISHASSVAALYALYQRLPNDMWLFNEKDDLIYYQIVADSVASRYPGFSRIKALRKEITERKQTLELADRLQQAALQDSTSFPEIALEDHTGKLQRLSDQKGKVILLDFWSVKDANYGIQNAEMKELYTTYAPQGFAIYQVSLGDVKAEWIETVNRQRLPWINVYDPRGSAGMAAMSYNIQSVPANILIAKDGSIVGRNLFGDALKNKLTEQFY